MAPTIVPATEDLMSEIEAWLDLEERDYKRGDRDVRGFRCNWDSAKKAWREGIDKVDVLMVDGKPLGFLNDMDILEIHPGHRGLGYGKQLADFMLARAADEGYSVVEIQIAPDTSEPFWVRQGFIPEVDDPQHRNGLYAQKLLPRDFPLGDGPRVPVTVEFFGESERYKAEPAFSSFLGEGESLADGSIQLPNRLHGFDQASRKNYENHIKIVVAGEEIYFGRARYGTDHGPSKDPAGNLYIDRIISTVGQANRAPSSD